LKAIDLGGKQEEGEKRKRVPGPGTGSVGGGEKEKLFKGKGVENGKEQENEHLQTRGTSKTSETKIKEKKFRGSKTKT